MSRIIDIWTPRNQARGRTELSPAPAHGRFDPDFPEAAVRPPIYGLSSGPKGRPSESL
jgi:hypothetical protein